MWRQFYNHARTGVRSAYVAMFDEYNEGNQIAPTAATSADVPAGSGIRPLDEDGTACSPDFYLRLTGDGGRMLRGEIAVTPTIPTPFKAGTPAPTAEPTTTATPDPTPSATSAAPTPAPTAAQPTASRPPAPPLPSATPSAVPPLGARPGPDRGRWCHRWARRWRARHGRRGHRR